MSTARSIINKLVAQGVIPAEYADTAVVELDRELARKARRISQQIAAMSALRSLGINLFGKN